MAKTETKITPSFTKEQYLKSDRFTSDGKDILQALLVDGESYTPEQVNSMVNDFLKKEA